MKHIYARSIDEIHNSILKGFSIDKILTPEEDAARKTVLAIKNDTENEIYKIDDRHYVIKFNVSESLAGNTLDKLNLAENFNLKIVAVMGQKISKNFLGISETNYDVIDETDVEYVLNPGDKIICFGLYKDILAFWKRVNQ